MVVIPIETANLLRFFRTLQLSADKAVLRTVAGLKCPVHNRSRVAVCCGSDAAFASAPANGQPESDRCRESGAAVSRLCVSGSPLITQDAGFVVAPAIHPTVDRAAQPAGAPPHARSSVATL